MKVLARPPPPIPWSQEMKCGCGAVLLVEADDLYRSLRRDLRGESYNAIVFRCAVCDAEREMTASVPERIAANARLRTAIDCAPKHRRDT